VPAPPPTPEGQGKHRGWIWNFVFGNDWPAWPEHVESEPGPRPVEREARGAVRVTLVNHATFLIQMDGLNILTDPMWSERCSPVSWAGPKRHRSPGIRFEDLPPIDAVLVSHNHYDHLDLPTLERLASRFKPRALTPFGNGDLLREAKLSNVQELDWWEAVPLSADVTVTLVPAQHFSSRTLWDRNEALWGGFVVSGPAGNVYFAGDTGYGPHFREIAKRFAPLRFALLPISPFHPAGRSTGEAATNHARVHLGPEEAVQAHLDLGAPPSLAGHFQTFQLGDDDFEEAPRALALAALAKGLRPDAFVIPEFGQAQGDSRLAARAGTE
jgi:L-ascorbate metabolism protein UlaG (beta-lactamase superfamily)